MAYFYSMDASTGDAEMYNFTEMIGFPSKNLDRADLWNRFLYPFDENQTPLSLSSTIEDLRSRQTTPFRVRNSKYLEPAQELLNDLCNLQISKTKSRKWNPQNDAESTLSHTSFDLHKRKTKLLQMLQQVDRRYRQYDAEMKAVVQSFEAAAGAGAAAVYSATAAKAISRHFRCLRDGIVGQIKAVKKAMGEKESGKPSSTKGDTPRFRIVDEKIRALHQIESHPWRPQSGLPERAISLLRAWLFDHFLNPYPTDVDKHILARQTGLSRSQVSNWFINARVRVWKPMVEAMYLEDVKEEKVDINQSPSTREDNKPTRDQPMMKTDSASLSSIINKNEYAPLHFDHHHFSSYNHGAAASFLQENGGVSLTLGLHQHGESDGVSIAFSQASHESNLFYPTDVMGDCQTGHYSLLDSENQNLTYRSSMGAQFLRDF